MSARTSPTRELARCALFALMCACGGVHRLDTRAAAPDAGRPDAAPDATGAEPPMPALGLEAYRAWDRMYRIRIGTRTYMRSTYDRAGGNEGADASHFLRQEDDRFIALDVQGPGVLTFARANRWHGSPWHYAVDGRDHVVTESSTADPLQPVAGSVFMPERAFPSPLALTWATTQGADLSWVPIGFTQRLTLGYERTHYGTGYFIYQALPQPAPGAPDAVEAFDERAPDEDVLALLARAGQDIGARGPGVETRDGSVDLEAGEPVQLAAFANAGVLVALKLTLPPAQALAADGARLRVYFDDAEQPAIDAPLPLFFGTGTFYNRADAEWLGRGLLFSVRYGPDALELASYFPMPFLSSARIELVGGAVALSDVGFSLRRAPYTDPPAWAAHFHATYRDHGTPVPGEDLVLLDTTQVEGGGRDYCGSFAGTSFIFSDQGDLTTLEGDPRFFFDDSASPQAYGTGTEEWAGGGDYFGGENVTLPLAGHPVGAPLALLAQDDKDLIESAYRVLIADAMPFGKNARITLEHGGSDDSSEHYQSVVYWYGRPGACLVRTDALDVGDEADERAHDYVSDSASDPVEVRSRYELGVDHTGEQEVQPEATERGRSMSGTTELTLALRRDNQGVLLRRTLDYGFPDQRAEVFVSGADDGGDFEPAGVWYLAGSNRSVYSNPAGELDPPDPVIETSNRRLREDEFLIDRAFTAGRTRIRVRLVFAPERIPITPDAALPELAFSELRFQAYCWVMPP